MFGHLKPSPENIGGLQDSRIVFIQTFEHRLLVGTCQAIGEGLLSSVGGPIKRHEPNQYVTIEVSASVSEAHPLIHRQLNPACVGKVKGQRPNEPVHIASSQKSI